MTYLHKLAMRLARVRGLALVLPAAAIFACSVGDSSPAGPGTRAAIDGTAPAPGTILLQENFEDNAFASRGWYDNTAMAITDTEHVAGSTHALEVHLPVGATTPTWGGAARHLFTASPTAYVSYWVKYSDNWVGSGHPYHPHEFLMMSDLDGDYDGPSDNWLTAYVEENYQNGGIPRIQLQDSKAINTSYGAPPIDISGLTENRSVDGCNGISEPNVVTSCFSFPPWYNDKEFSPGQVAFQPTPGPGYKGNWNHVEAYFQINSIVNGVGQADGVVQYWFNGALLIDRHDVRFRTGARPSINFHQFLIAPYIGDGSPANQYMWIDNLTVATSPLASSGSASVASVTVSPATSSVTVGGTTQLAATTLDSAGNVLTGQPVTWTSGNTGVATVSGAGLVSGVAAGSATITATSGGISGTATVTVTAPITNPGTVSNLSATASTDTSVTLSFTQVDDGTGHPASYEVRQAAGTMSWGSAADVTRGSCQSPLAGTAISATRTCTVLGLTAATAYQFELVAFRGTLNLNAVFGGLSNVASKSTTASVATITVTPASATLIVGGTQLFAATLKDASGNVLTGRTVTWSSSNAAVATLSGSTATAVATGSATIRAASGTVTGTATLTVGTVVPVASVTVTPATKSQNVGATQQFAATLKDATGNVLTGRTIAWSSSNTAVATVNTSGLETGVAAGTATITATSEGKSGTAAVTVTVGKPGTVTNLKVSATTTSGVTLSFTEVGDGMSKPASYEVRYAAGTLSWGSAPDVSQGTCAVPVTGTAIGAARTCTVLGLAPGTAYQFQLVAFRGTLNVNAVFGGLSNVASGTTATSTAPVATVSVSPASASLAVGGTQQLSATLKDASGNVLTGRVVTWASSAGTVATVSGSGMATGMAAGAATLTATSEGMTGSSVLTVTAAPPPPPPGSWANEPMGFSLLSDYGFSDNLALVNDGPVGSSGWKIINPDNGQPLTAGHAVSAADLTAPMGSSIAQFLYPVGMRDGYAPATMYYDGFSATSLYAGFWWKPSAPWQTDGSGVNKIAFVFIGGSTMYISMNWNGSVYHLRVEDEINSPTTNYDPNVTLTPITLGQWHKVEWTVSATGGTKFWLDGVLQGSYPNLRWSGAFSMFQLSPTWGGNGGDVKSELDSYSYNHVHISKQ